jgi:HPt (histidine-containing phosphotransfer) domain-containing protein
MCVRRNPLISDTTVITFPKATVGVRPVWSPTAELKEIAETDASMLPALISLFLDDSTARLQNLIGAGVRQDFKTVHAEAHSMKGSALQMGAPALASLCAEVELSDRPGPEQCELTIRAVGDELQFVRVAMEAYISSPETTGLQAGSKEQSISK